MTAKTREDAVNSDNNKEIFLKNAPNSDEDYFLVPKVVE
jgi:aspartyl/glutamyl-tRNA(Asn/Gln) amidotransferase C subunit